MSDVLTVYWSNKRVGHIKMESGKLSFQYDAAWLNDPFAIPISLRLPLRGELFESDEAGIFFSNLLPEGVLRELIAKRLGVSGKNDFKLLEELGGECAGALSLLPDGKVPDATGTYKRLPKEELDRMIEAMPAQPLLAASEMRLSLAGAQQKLPVYVKGGEIHLPQGASSSSHILKPGIPHYEDTVSNEFFCMKLADKCGLDVPEVEMEKSRYLLVRRYDRSSLSGEVTRLHQEDFCQALGYRYDQKYQAEGGPGLKECFALLDKHSGKPILDKRSMLRWVIYNYLIGNCDAHAKNISLLITADGVRLAPFYDLMSTVVYPGLSPKMAMKIGGEARPDYVMKRHWERLADEAGVGFKAVLGAYQDLEEALPAAALQLEKDLAPNPLIRKINEVLRKRMEFLKKNL